MTHPPTKRLALAAVLLASVAQPAWAGAQTNVMNNIVTLADACSIAAIGVDFGVTTFPIPAAGVTAVTAASANNGVANATSGNANHPYYAKDANDTLTLTTPVSAANGLLSTALSTVSSKLGTPGVYVVCTVTPSKVTLTSANGGAPANLPVTTGSASPVGFTGNMIGVGAGATSANTLNYTLMLTPVVASAAVPSTPVNIFTGIYSVLTATIPGNQSGNNPAVGHYWDGAVAEVDY